MRWSGKTSLNDKQTFEQKLGWIAFNLFFSSLCPFNPIWCFFLISFQLACGRKPPRTLKYDKVRWSSPPRPITGTSFYRNWENAVVLCRWPPTYTSMIASTIPIRGVLPAMGYRLLEFLPDKFTWFFPWWTSFCHLFPQIVNPLSPLPEFFSFVAVRSPSPLSSIALPPLPVILHVN